MELYVGIVVGLAGVVCILAGVKGRGTNLFTAVTGTAATSSTAGGFGGGGDFGGSFGSPAAPSPLRPGPAASVGPGSGSGAVMFA